MIVQQPWIDFIRKYKHTPSLIRRVIICTELKYFDRALLGAFCIGNDINILEFFYAIKSVNRLAPAIHLFKLIKVCEWLLKAEHESNFLILDKYFYYDMTLRQTFYLSGREYNSPAVLSGLALTTSCVE